MKRTDWNIIAKHLTNEPLGNEEQEYLKQAASDRELKDDLDSSAAMMNKIDLLYKLKKFDTNKAWNNVNRQITQKSRTGLNPYRLLKIAAILLLVFATALITVKVAPAYLNNKFKTSQSDFTCPQVTLPDGTQVTLNHGSQLVYPKQFKGKFRKVSLKGEAFFEVTDNRHQPFVIKVKGALVKVLGTSFNVKLYNDNPLVEVIVKTGQVELSGNKPDEKDSKMLLRPGEKGMLNKTTGKLTRKPDYDPNQLAWVTHKIEFHAARLSEVTATLKAVYNIQIRTTDDVDTDQVITATFRQQEPGYILDVIALTLDLDISVTGKNSYYIKNK